MKFFFNKYVLIPVAILIAVGVVTISVRSCSANKRAEQYTGTPEQDRSIFEELTTVFAPEHGIAERLLVMQNLKPTLSRMSPEKRQAMQVNAILTAVDRSLSGLSSLSPEEKKKKIKLICKDANTSYDFYKQLPEEKKRKIKEILTGDGQKMFNQVNTTIVSRLSPADREALAPAIKTWHQVLKGK